MDYNFQQPDKRRGGKGSSTVVIIIVVITLTILCIVIGTFFAISKTIGSSLKENTSDYNVSVTAEITENLERHEGNVTIYTPVYEYEYRGRSYRVVGRVSMRDKKYEVGQKVDIMIKDQLPGKIYDPGLNRETIFKNFGKEATMAFLPFIIVPLLFMVICASVIIIAAAHNNTKKRISAMQSKVLKTERDEYYDPNDDYRG